VQIGYPLIQTERSG